MSTNTRISNSDAKVIYPELSYTLNGIFYRVQNKLGRFCKEKQYSDAIEMELKYQNLEYKRETRLPQIYDGRDLGGNTADFVVMGKILIEVKAKTFITREDFLQTLRYIKAANLRLGPLVNFRSRYLRIRRLLN